MSDRRFYEQPAADPAIRVAPAAARNLLPVQQMLAEWLPDHGLVLEIASGTGEHALAYARAFPDLIWQPSDIHPDALASIAARQRAADLPNLLPPLTIDVAQAAWGLARADAIVSLNMVHISSWESSLGLLAGSASLLGPGAPLILYGPWIEDDVETSPSNLAFDADLKARNPAWGLRRVRDFADEAGRRDLILVDRRAMPANNIMLRFVRH